MTSRPLSVTVKRLEMSPRQKHNGLPSQETRAVAFGAT